MTYRAIDVCRVFQLTGILPLTGWGVAHWPRRRWLCWKGSPALRTSPSSPPTWITPSAKTAKSELRTRWDVSENSEIISDLFRDISTWQLVGLQEGVN